LERLNDTPRYQYDRNISEKKQARKNAAKVRNNTDKIIKASLKLSTENTTLNREVETNRGNQASISHTYAQTFTPRIHKK